MRKWSQRLIAKTKKYFQDKLEASSTTDDEQNEDDSESEESEAEVAAASGSTKERKQRVLSMRDLQVHMQIYKYARISTPICIY